MPFPIEPATAIAAASVAGALLILALTAAIQGAITYVSRRRVHVYASRTGVDAGPLHHAIAQRNALLAATETVKTIAGIFVTITSLVLVLRATGLRTGAALIAGVIISAIVLTVLATARAIVRHNPEYWGVRLAPIGAAYVVLFGWLGRSFEIPARLLVRLFRIPQPSVDEEGQEEILRLVELEESTDGIEEEERQMIRGIISLEDTTAREIMVPRIDIGAVSADQTLDDAVQVIVSRGFSRVPLYEGNIDTIIGVIYAKDLLGLLASGRSPERLTEVARPAHFIPESKKVGDLLAELRQNRVHMAIVVDEYGGTAGLVTIEDLLEEIVGEIEDEYDRGEERVQRLNDDEAIVDGRVSIDVLEDLFGIDVENEDVDTIGGYVYNQLGRIPVAGDTVTAGGLTISVLSVTGHRIKKLRIVRNVREPSAPSEARD